MSEPFLAEIRIVAFNFPPRGWSFCDGQILPINQNQSLYSLLGTTYGGDGRTTFALPDLRGRAPLHFDSPDFRLGVKRGEETHALTVAEMPNHDHTLNATNNDATADDPTSVASGAVMARAVSQVYGSLASPAAMGAGSVLNAGGGQGHNNMQPYLTLSFCIALQGLFPSRN